MKVPRESFQQLEMILEDMHHREGLLYPSIKAFSLACVTLAIIMVMRLYIVEPMLDIEMNGAETGMKTPSTKSKKIISGIHS